MKVNDVNIFPKKGDTVVLDNEEGVCMDDEFEAVLWPDGSIEEWSGLWGTFIDAGGYIKK